jgi:hypothetical protein
MANISGAVQIETGIKHGLSIPVQSVAVEQSIDVGTLLGTTIGEVVGRWDLLLPGAPAQSNALRGRTSGEHKSKNRWGAKCFHYWCKGS